jgi:TRAP-type C4-dicarboxylate transport system substrate-binding protein
MKALRDFLKSQGGQVIPLSDAEANRWVKAVQPVLADYKKGMI